MIDINSELDELDREEFYRLKKVRIQHKHCLSRCALGCNSLTRYR